MIICYSGFGCAVSNPEVCLADAANLMLTFADSRGKKEPHPRFAAVHAARREKYDADVVRAVFPPQRAKKPDR